MASYIIVLYDLKTDKPVTTHVVEAATDMEACIIAASYADTNGYALGDIVRRDAEQASAEWDTEHGIEN
jgi:hypothetical protein